MRTLWNIVGGRLAAVALGALSVCPSMAGEGFQWVARPVVVPPGQTARLTLDLHVPAGVGAVEYEVEVSSADDHLFRVGPLEVAHGRWDRPDHQVQQGGRLPLHLPMTAVSAPPGVHRVVLHAKVRTCSGKGVRRRPQRRGPGRGARHRAHGVPRGRRRARPRPGAGCPGRGRPRPRPAIAAAPGGPGGGQHG